VINRCQLTTKALTPNLRLRYILALVIMAVLVAFYQPVNTGMLQDASRRIEVYISTDKTKYKLREPIILTIEICNTNPFCVVWNDGWLLGINYDIIIKDERGRILPYRRGNDQPAESDGHWRFKLYNPGECNEIKINLTKTLLPNDLESFDPIFGIDDYGKYTVDVELEGRYGYGGDLDYLWKVFKASDARKNLKCGERKIEKDQMISLRAGSDESVTFSVEAGVFNNSPKKEVCATENIKAEISQEYHPLGTRDGPMLLIPAGEFTMGIDPALAFLEMKKYSIDCPLYIFVHQGPAHIVNLPSYYIDKYEVTQSEYDRCVKAEKCKPHEKIDGNIGPHQPVIGVNWYDAKAYCGYAGKRLPTEAEWEKAARGTDCRLFPWGNEFEEGRSNFHDKKHKFTDSQSSFDGFTAPVGSYPYGASPYGAMDMAGNVVEWTSDCVKNCDEYTSKKAICPNHEFRVNRGSWYGQPICYGLVTERQGFFSCEKVAIGMRCARSY